MHPNLSCCVPAGEIIKPWLVLGPFYEDLSETVQGLTLFEKPGASAGRAAMAQIAAEARTILASRPVEGEETAFRGQGRRWELVRGPEKYLSWGRYNISNHLGAAFLTTLATPDQPGVQAWRLMLGITSRAIVAINGATIYDTDEHPLRPVDGIFEHRFDAALMDGENVVSLALFRLGRMAQVGFRLEAAAGLSARVPLPPDVPAELRDAVEVQAGSIRLSRDVFYGEHDIGFRLGAALAQAHPLGEPAAGSAPKTSPGAVLTVTLRSEDGETLRTLQPAHAGPVVLCGGDEVPDGHYELLCSWTTAGDPSEGASRRPLTSVSFAIYRLTPVPPLPGQERLAERQRRVLEHYASFRRAEHRPDIWREVARYALGSYDDVDEDVIRDTCQFIAARKDCADFVIQGILRLMCWEREQSAGESLRGAPRLSPQIHALMKDAVLGFKYWVDEPGDTVM